MPKKKVIFIHGLAGSKKQANTSKNILNNYEVVSFEYDLALSQPIEKIALELKKFIDSKTAKKEKVNLIGVSAGGIIADYYRKFVAPEKVDKVATICSPFEGTYITRIYPKKRKGVKELSRNSEFLRKLRGIKNEGRTINFYCPLDVLVPGSSGKGENPVRTNNFFHFTVHMDKRILKKIKDFLDK